MNLLKKILAGAISTSIAMSCVPAYAFQKDSSEQKSIRGSFNSTAVEGNILHYDMTVENEYLVDKINNNNGSIKNLTDEDIIAKERGNTLLFNNDANPLYVEIPNGTVNGLKDVSISAIVNWKGGVNSSWLYTLGTNSGKYLFVTPSNNSSKLQTGFASGNNLSGWQTEKGVGDRSRLEPNTWSMITITFSSESNTLSLYRDGVLVGKNTDIPYELADIITSGLPNGYIGKSFYKGDPYFSGELADFKIFDRAISQEEVITLKEEADEVILPLSCDSLNYDYILKDNSSKDSVITDLNLPVSLGDVSIAWESSNNKIITTDGKVNRPESTEFDETVTLTATVTLNGKSITKIFEVKVLKEFSDLEKIKIDSDNLLVNNIEDVRGNLTLPTVGTYGSSITWESSNDEIINTNTNGETPAGVVVRQDNDVEVILKASLNNGDEVLVKEFTAKVIARSEELNYDAYIFTYFIGEEFAQGEQVYLGTSEDGLNWKEVNKNKPILTSQLGEGGVRDPFIIRSPEGDKFYMIATDLRIHNGNGWGAAQFSGSKSIMIWESTDLVNWSEQRMVKVALDTAGSTWAPEVFYDKTTGEYIVFWASRDNNRPDNNGNYHHRMYYAKTRDFYTFTEPELYNSIELDNNSAADIIDATMIEDNGVYYRWTKNEVTKKIFMEKSDSVLGDWELVESNVIRESGVEGPTVFKFNDRDEWCLLLDNYGGKNYYPLVTEDLASGNFRRLKESEYSLPKGASSKGPRHGTVIPVTREEYNRIMDAYDAVNKTSLEKSISEADRVDKSLYTKESVQVMEAALEKAREILTSTDAIQTDVYNAVVALDSSINKLVEKVVDKNELQESVNKAIKLDQNNYTEDSWKEFKEILNIANSILDNENTTQEEVDTAKENLEKAMEELIEKEPEGEIVIQKITKFKSEVSKNEVKLTWDEPSSKIGVTGYIIYKDGKELEEVLVGSTEYTAGNLRANTIYGFKIVIKYSNGEVSKPKSINVRTSSR